VDLAPTPLPSRTDDANDWRWMWARDTGILVAAQFVTSLMTSLLAILIARHLAPHTWGIFASFLAVSQAASILIDFGLSTWLLRQLSQFRHPRDRNGWNPEEAGGLVSHALTLAGGICFGILGVAIAFTFFDPETPLIGTALLLLLTYTGAMALAVVLETVFRARRELRLVLISAAIEKGLTLIAVLYAVAVDGPLWALALAYLLGGITRLAFDIANTFGRNRIQVMIPRTMELLRLAKAALPFAMNVAAMNLLPALDIPVIAATSVVDAGYFAVGYRIVALILVLPAVGASALYPILAGRERGLRITLLASTIAFGLGAVFAAAAALVAPLAVPSIFGMQYSDATVTVQTMMIVLPITFASSIMLVGLYSSGLERHTMSAIGAASIVGTTAVAVGESQFGSVGAGCGYILRQLLLLLGLLVLAARSRRSRSGLPRAHDRPT
jgi:O-antigen/teichoic acid export membrane protein